MNWRRYFERKRRDEETAHEIDSYLRHEIDGNLARGLSLDEARLAAHRKFGNTTTVREAIHDMNTLGAIDTVLRDLKYAARQLGRNPVFAVTAMLSLALGIGANTAIFTLTDQILLRLLPVDNPRELVQLRLDGGRVGPQSGDGVHTFSHPTFLALRERNTVFSGMTGQLVTTASLIGTGPSELISVGLVAGNYFDVLGVKAHRGRMLSPEDDRVKNGGPVAVLQYDFWRNRYESKPEMVGATIRVNGSPFTVIGVAAPGFEGTETGFLTNIWTPVTMKPAIMPTNLDLEDERSSWLAIFARLNPGVQIAQAEAAMKVTWRQRQEEELHGAVFQKYPPLRDKFLGLRFGLEPAERGQSRLRTFIERPLLLLQWLVGAVLLIACSNVAGLLMARAAARDREMAIRGSLGASRGRLIRQLLAESLLLAFAGGCAGLAVGRWITAALIRFIVPDQALLSLSASPDARILLFAAGLTLGTTLLFGLLPAWQASRVEAAAALKESGGATGGSKTRVRTRKAFVAFQVGLSTMLLIGAGLFARTLGNLRNIDLGMKAENVATFYARPATVYDDPRKLQLYRSLVEGLAQVPGVKAVGANTVRLLMGGRSDGSITIAGVASDPLNPSNSFFNMITPGYFEALGIPVKLGRDLSWRDWGGPKKLCLVNEQLVSDYLGGRNPVGLMLGRGADTAPDNEIIGVFGNARYHDPRGQFPRQTFVAMDGRMASVPGVNVYARIQGDPRPMMARLRERVREIDANVVVSDMRTLDDQLNLRLANERMLSFLSGGFAVLAAILAVTGLYGVLAFVVTRRNREIGIRVALGARRGQVIALVLREMAVVIVVGIGAGLAAGAYCGRFLETQLYGVKPFDLTVYAAAAGALAAASLAAAFLPAWRAARLDPMAALRPE